MKNIYINYLISYQEVDTLNTSNVSFKAKSRAEARVLAAEVLVFYASRLKLNFSIVHLYGEVKTINLPSYWSEISLDPCIPEELELEEKAIADLDSALDDYLGGI